MGEQDMNEQGFRFKLNPSHAYDFLRGTGVLGDAETTSSQEVRMRIRAAIRERFLGNDSEDVVLMETGELEITPEKLKDIYLRLRAEGAPTSNLLRIVDSIKQEIDTYITSIGINLHMFRSLPAEKLGNIYQRLLGIASNLSENAPYLHIINDLASLNEELNSASFSELGLRSEDTLKAVQEILEDSRQESSGWHNYYVQNQVKVDRTLAQISQFFGSESGKAL